MKKQRPINLDLTTIRFPVTAVSSILHRISGVVTFISLGILLWLLGLSLSDMEGFLQVASMMDSFFAKCIIWGILTALAYHVVSGIRYILMDFGYLSETLAVGIRSSQVTFVITVVFSILAGVLIW